MEHINRSKDFYLNNIIYQLFTEADLEHLSDEEFRILQINTANSCILPYVEPLYHDYFAGQNSIELKGKGDHVDMRIYQRKSASEIGHLGCYERYVQVFALSRLLGVKNIYDIGCGNQLQAFLLTFSQDINYIGIDDQFKNWPENFELDPDYCADLFQKFTATNRFKFIKNTYPCELDINQGNIAIAIAVCCNLKSPRQKNILKTMGNEFERIIFDIQKSMLNKEITAGDIPDIISKKISVWYDPTDEFIEEIRKLLPGFEIFNLGGDRSDYIFATKIKEDLDVINKKFTITGNKITTGLFDLKYTNLIDFQPVE